MSNPTENGFSQDAKLKNLIICQPENRNRFNKIFGGFIMRQAFELAWANTYTYRWTTTPSYRKPGLMFIFHFQQRTAFLPSHG